MATIIELLEAHLRVDAYEGPATCSCEEWESRRTGMNSTAQHRSHIAELLEQHMQEREARSWSAGFHKGRKTENGSHISTWPKNPYRKESSDGR